MSNATEIDITNRCPVSAPLQSNLQKVRACLLNVPGHCAIRILIGLLALMPCEYYTCAALYTRLLMQTYPSTFSKYLYTRVTFCKLVPYAPVADWDPNIRGTCCKWEVSWRSIMLCIIFLITWHCLISVVLWVWAFKFMTPVKKVVQVIMCHSRFYLYHCIFRKRCSCTRKKMQWYNWKMQQIRRLYHCPAGSTHWMYRRSVLLLQHSYLYRYMTTVAVLEIRVCRVIFCFSESRKQTIYLSISLEISNRNSKYSPLYLFVSHSFSVDCRLNLYI